MRPRLQMSQYSLSGWKSLSSWTLRYAGEPIHVTLVLVPISARMPFPLPRKSTSPGLPRGRAGGRRGNSSRREQLQADIPICSLDAVGWKLNLCGSADGRPILAHKASSPRELHGRPMSSVGQGRAPAVRAQSCPSMDRPGLACLSCLSVIPLNMAYFRIHGRSAILCGRLVIPMGWSIARRAPGR
jgi:hypothetical protein